MKKWTIIDIYHGFNKYYKLLELELIKFIEQNIYTDGLFYNNYSHGTEGDCIKIGFIENPKFKKKIMNKFKEWNKKGYILNIKETILNFPVRGNKLNIDDIKTLALRLTVFLKKIVNDYPKKENRIYLELFHHIMNQMGKGYNNEYEIYKAIEERWRNVLFNNGDKKEKRKFKR